MKKEVTIIQVSGTHECETCGTYESIDTSLYLDGILLESYQYDDHLGGGLNLSYIEEAGPIFEALGFSFKYEKEYTDDQ